MMQMKCIKQQCQTHSQCGIQYVRWHCSLGCTNTRQYVPYPITFDPPPSPGSLTSMSALYRGQACSWPRHSLDELCFGMQTVKHGYPNQTCDNINLQWVWCYHRNEFQHYEKWTKSCNKTELHFHAVCANPPPLLFPFCATRLECKTITKHTHLSVLNFKSPGPSFITLPWLWHPPLWPPAAVLDTDSWPAEPQPEICGGWWWRCCWARPCGSGASESPGMKMGLGGGGGRSYGSDQRMRSPRGEGESGDDTKRERESCVGI